MSLCMYVYIYIYICLYIGTITSVNSLPDDRGALKTSAAAQRGLCCPATTAPGNDRHVERRPFRSATAATKSLPHETERVRDVLLTAEHTVLLCCCKAFLLTFAIIFGVLYVFLSLQYDFINLL